MRYLAIIACLALGMTACSKDDAATKKPAPTKATTAATAKPKPTAKTAAKDKDAELDKEDIPVAADYEDKAEKEISEDNLEKELAKLEKELTDDPDGEKAEKKN